ncbi:MAG: hypothetical protein CL831_10300 [Crocinitomicaceae bacterium]|nr:hypothetical protein [Crocinitomicaceae bacterium]|tara:strand:+ start:49 stop:588 length:540 start_codon:yes stop_codon:yes gene_type:complete
MRINQLVWQHGGMAALISVILSLVAYILSVELLIGWQLGLAQSVLIITTMIIVGRAIRRDEGGFISYWRVFQHIMLSLLCILCASSLFNFVLFNVINPELVDVVVDLSLEKVEEMMISFGLEGDLLQETMIETQKEIRNGYTLVGSVKGVVFSSMFGAIIALIVSATQYRIDPQKPNFN